MSTYTIPPKHTRESHRNAGVVEDYKGGIASCFNGHSESKSGETRHYIKTTIFYLLFHRPCSLSIQELANRRGTSESNLLDGLVFA